MDSVRKIFDLVDNQIHLGGALAGTLYRMTAGFIFGGVAGVEYLEDGHLDAAGDPRRGGHGIVVD